MDGQPTWTDCDEVGDYVVPNVLSPRDLVSRPDIMDETVLHISRCCTPIKKVKYKLTRNKKARHIFPRHFFTIAIISIISLYMHFILYIFHTRSLFFKYLHHFPSYDNHCTKCTCTSCAPTTRLYGAKICF